MAAINWHRMGLTRKAVGHIVAGVVVAIVGLLISMFIAQGIAEAFILLVSLVFLIELYQQTKTDLAAYKENGGIVSDGSLALGCLVGLRALVAWVLIALGTALQMQ